MQNTTFIEEKRNKKKLLSSLGVYELRGLARAIGIKSPTTKVREKLIDEISAALATGHVAEPRETNKGRPSKPLANIDDLLVAVQNGSLKEFALNQNQPVFELDEGEKVAPTLVKTFSFGTLVLGGKNVITTNGALNESKNISDMLSQLCQTNQQVVFVSASLTFEEKQVLSTFKNLNVFASSYTDTDGKLYEKLLDATSFVSSQTSDVCVVIFDVARILAELDQRFDHINKVHATESILLVKRVFSLSSQYKSGKAITTICVYDETDGEDQFIKQNIIKISHKIEAK